ncbi:MAG: response regulator [Phycisphaerales bacterium]|nr:response regulator [Phycisphaerales bacterium]MCB9863918.1 response regulator [Phycisphaerales bacterium]
MNWTPDQQLRILLIDDDDIDGQLLSIYLKKISHHIDFTQCVKEGEALDAIDSTAFDLIFVDNRLCVWTGSEMLQALREHGYTGPTVLYTAAVEPGAKTRLRELQCHDFLEKGDVSINTLRTTIESAMSRTSTN